MKYPKKIKKEKLLIKIPVYDGDSWFCTYLKKDGTIVPPKFASHSTKNGCFACCDSYNNYIGYTDDEVIEIKKHFNYNEKGQRKTAKKKGKEKKSKK